MLRLAKQRDRWGRPQCMLTFFYSPDCVFSAKVADTFFRAAVLFPKLLILAVDVSVGGKGTERWKILIVILPQIFDLFSLISHYGISSTPVIALWQDGFPRYRLYEDYSKLNTLIRVLKQHTDLTPLPEKEEREHNEDEKGKKDKDDGNEEKEGTGPELGREQFLSQFRYLREDLGFDWLF